MIEIEIDKLPAGELAELCESQRKLIASLMEENRNLSASVEDCMQQIARPNEMIACKNKNLFGRKSETASTLQLYLDFETSEVKNPEAKAAEAGEGEEAPVKKKRKKKSGKFAGIQEEVTIDHDDKTELEKKYGAGNIVETGTQVIGQLAYVPGRFIMQHHLVHLCEVKNESTPSGDPLAVPAEKPEVLLEGSVLTPSLFAFIFTERFFKGCPWYRLESLFKRNGVPVGRQIMCFWFIKVMETCLSALVEFMKDDLGKCEIRHGDETTWKCIEDKSHEKNYIWVQCSGASEEKQIVVFSYSDGRDSEFAMELYEGHGGYLGCGHYVGYEKLGMKRQLCFDHARRRAAKAVECDPAHAEYKRLKTKEERSGFLATHEAYALKAELLSKIDRIYMLERKFKDMSPQERKTARDKESRPALDELKEFLDNASGIFVKEGYMGEAVNYLLNGWDLFCTFLEDGRIEIANGRAERMIKNVVIGRKNSLFSSSRNGAGCTADAYTIMETCKANGLKPYDYIEYVLEQMASMKGATKEKLRELLPYGKSLPERLYAKKKG